MDQSDKSYLEGVTNALDAVSGGLQDLLDQIDCLRAEISVMTDDFVGRDEIARKCGFDENDN